MSVCALGLLVLALALINTRVRDQFAQDVSLRRPAGLESVGQQMLTDAASVLQAVRDVSFTHAPLTVVVVAAVVLVTFMLRT